MSTPKLKTTLLFDTALATSNLGDEIILECTKIGLSRLLDRTMNFRLATHIANYSAFQMLYKGKKMRSICLEADYKFICGTNCLVENLLHIRPQLSVNPFNAKLYKNVILVGVGKDSDYSEFKNKYTRHLYQSILSKQYKHSVRDENTKRMVESLGFKAINTGCPTLWGFDEQKCSLIPNSKQQNVVFSVSGYSDQLDRKKDIQMIHTLSKNYDKLYAWIQTTEDEKYLRSIIDVSKHKIQLICSLRKFSDVLKNADVDYIGTRLHGGVYALQHGVRSVIISIDQRAEGFHESNNLPILRRSDMDELEALINSSFETRIHVNRDAINEFVSQFE